MSRAGDADALVELLNVLLEAERAGVAAVADLERVAPDRPEVRAMLAELGRDEARYAAGLREQVLRLGGEPSARTGDFIDKIRALPGFAEKLSLLDRGQRWVARRIAERLDAVDDPETHAFLAEMRERHDINVERCAALLDDPS